MCGGVAVVAPSACVTSAAACSHRPTAAHDKAILVHSFGRLLGALPQGAVRCGQEPLVDCAA